MSREGLYHAAPVINVYNRYELLRQHARIHAPLTRCDGDVPFTAEKRYHETNTMGNYALPRTMLIGCATAGGPDAGNFTMQYTKNSPIPVGDWEGHIIYLGKPQGMSAGGSKDGSEVLSRDYVDIPNSGFLPAVEMTSVNRSSLL